MIIDPEKLRTGIEKKLDEISGLVKEVPNNRIVSKIDLKKILENQRIEEANTSPVLSFSSNGIQTGDHEIPFKHIDVKERNKEFHATIRELAPDDPLQIMCTKDESAPKVLDDVVATIIQEDKKEKDHQYDIDQKEKMRIELENKKSHSILYQLLCTVEASIVYLKNYLESRL
jgi:hypothetical protein